jgi:hypothetical protein
MCVGFPLIALIADDMPTQTKHEANRTPIKINELRRFAGSMRERIRLAIMRNGMATISNKVLRQPLLFEELL